MQWVVQQRDTIFPFSAISSYNYKKMLISCCCSLL